MLCFLCELRCRDLASLGDLPSLSYYDAILETYSLCQLQTVTQMKKILIFVLCLCFSGIAALAQTPKLPLYKIEQTKGLFRQYKYGDTRFFNPQKLHVVIMSLNDEEASRQYRRYQTLSTLGLAASAGATTLIFVDAFDGVDQQGLNGLRATALGMGVASVVLQAVAMRPLKKSISRYNQVLAEKFDITYQPLPNSRPVLGLGFTHRF